MKAVAAALVLIAGAAVVLWYGNTLNSWVLGGLIGGLAAILLSIPISLTLFSFFSRRHDERLKAAVEEEVSLAQLSHYPEASLRVPQQSYEVESYVLSEEEEWEEEEEEDDYFPPVRPVRNLPAPSSPRLPVAHRGVQRLSPSTQSGYLPVPGAASSRSVPLARGKDVAGPATNSNRRMSYPGFPGYQPGSSRSHHHSAALRAARREAAQQQRFDDVEELPTYTSRRVPPARQNSALLASQGQVSERPAHHLQHNINHYPRRPRRTVDASPSQQGVQRSLPAEGESAASRLPRRREPQTDSLDVLSPRMNGLRYPGQTDKIARVPQLGEEPRNADTITGSLQRPLVRRAPYMYEDDPLRQELAQRLDPPVVRRSSRHLSMPQSDETE